MNNSSTEKLNDSERGRTNVGALYFCIGFVVVLFCVVGYASFNGDIDRLVRGIDDCGNVCGRENKKVDIKNCGANDKRQDPFTLVNITKNAINPNITESHSKCVKNCTDFPGYKLVANRCYFVETNGTEIDEAQLTSFMTNVAEDLVNSWLAILLSCLVALVFSFILLVLFRYAIKYVIWIIFIGIVVLLVFASVAFIAFYFFAASSKNPEEKEGAFILLIVAGVLALFALIIGLVIYFFRKRIALVVQLFKEASRALADIPTLIGEPILTFLALGLTCVGFLFFAVIIESSGRLQTLKDEKDQFDKAIYAKDFVMKAAHYLNFIGFMWFTTFIIDCQNFVIAGAVCQWFFARTKSKVESPLKKSFEFLMKFHIGSVCLGSVLITLVRIVRMIIENAKKSMAESQNVGLRMMSCCIDYLMELVEQFLKFLVRNAYIIVAMDGTPLISSGKKAFNLLSKNLLDVVALNKVGDFILFLGRIFVTLIAGFISYELIGKTEGLNYPAVPVVISVVFAFLIVHCFMVVYEMTVDTIFICFCEDCEQNDGVNRPYFMSRGMMEVMQELKQAAGGEFTFGGQNVEGGTMRPMIPPNHQFSN